MQCRGLFSTHYHRLAIDYIKDPKVYPVFGPVCIIIIGVFNDPPMLKRIFECLNLLMYLTAYEVTTYDPYIYHML